MSKATKENIRKLLALTGATHQQLADIAGVDRSAVSHWKSGKAEPRMGHLQRIADYFGITTSNLADPNGMSYVYKGRDGKLHDDTSARLGDLKQAVLSFDSESAANDLFMATLSLQRSLRKGEPLTSDEKELLDMFRSLNETGRELALAMVAALVNSSSYDK